MKLEHVLSGCKLIPVRGGTVNPRTVTSAVEQQITSNTYQLDYLLIPFTMIYAGKRATTALCNHVTTGRRTQRRNTPPSVLRGCGCLESVPFDTVALLIFT